MVLNLLSVCSQLEVVVTVTPSVQLPEADQQQLGLPVLV